MIASATVQRHSKELLNLRKIQNTLAKNKKYEEAAKLKAKADELVRTLSVSKLKFEHLLIFWASDDMGRREVA